LEKGPHIQVIAETGRGTDAIQLVKELKPDVLVLDIEMSDMQGDQVARKLRDMNLPISILILSACNDPHFIGEVMRSGVDGYLTKDETPERIRAAVHHVSQKQNLAANPLMFLLHAALLWKLYEILDTLKVTTDLNFF
jgi:DNA-binding NarL/FixJ family response regulator